MKNIIYVSLLIIAFSKINIIEYGKDIPFDINNNEFELTFNEAGALLVSVTFGTPDILKLNMIFKGNEYNYPVSPPGLGTIMLFKPNDINKIKLEYLSPSNENGTIWLQPTTEEIQIKLNQTYQWKYNLKAYFTQNKIYQLVYSINKSEKDAILEFKYDNNFNVENNIIAPNPLKICHGEICNNSITTYNITKGESYKIYITLKIFQKINKYVPVLIIYLPSFSFNFIYQEEKKHEEEKQEIEIQKEEEEGKDEEKKQEIETKKEEEIKQEEVKKPEEEIKQEEGTKQNEEVKQEEETKQEEKKEEGQEPKKEEEKEKPSEQSQKKEKSIFSFLTMNIILIITNIIFIILLVVTCINLCRKN